MTRVLLVSMMSSLLLGVSGVAGGCGSAAPKPEDPALATAGSIGVVLRFEPERGTLLFEKIATDGGAAAAGVTHHDRLFEIEGVAVKGMPLDEVVHALLGRIGSHVTLRVGPNEDDTREVVAHRAALPTTRIDCKSGDCRDGSGTSVDIYGDRYEGAFVNGRYHGKGKLLEPSGRWYEGDFADGEASGPGVFGDVGGVRFEATFAGGRPTGIVKIKFPNGDVYEGETDNYTMHGQGKLRRPSTGDTWSGRFELDKLVEGTWLHYPPGGDGRTCTRAVTDGVTASTGTIRYVPKDRKKRLTFEGAFGDDCVANGEGLMTYERNKKMQGPFAGDEPQKGAKKVK